MSLLKPLVLQLAVVEVTSKEISFLLKVHNNLLLVHSDNILWKY